jgi:hypothetical protein
MDNGNRPGSRLGAELSLWARAIAGSARELQRRRIARGMPAAGGAIRRGGRTVTGRRTPAIVAGVAGVSVAAWAVVNVLSGPDVAGSGHFSLARSADLSGDAAKTSGSATATGARSTWHATSGALPPAPALPAPALPAPALPAPALPAPAPPAPAVTSAGSTSQGVVNGNAGATDNGMGPVIPAHGHPIAAAEVRNHVRHHAGRHHDARHGRGEQWRAGDGFQGGGDYGCEPYYHGFSDQDGPTCF